MCPERDGQLFRLWKLQSVDYRLTTANRFGPGQGSVIVQSWITRVKVQNHSGSSVLDYSKANLSDFLFLDIPPETLDDAIHVEISNPSFDFGKDEDYEEILLEGKLHFIFSFVNLRRYRVTYWGATGLLLEKLSAYEGQKEPEKYRRVSIATIRIYLEKEMPVSDHIDRWQDRNFWDKLASQKTITIV
ncbi:hypothetical protein BS50DRAFT_20653 [Corynespora cassiicola Philippines]|uniref:Uncharacterized protein n=1 Tax=Corynespora cassiicola Philippines TaxID=1448308 RepID=A0A2T2PAG4_CORCC|nr:hypothetical protein BS50DRAFT_20653 [Corynespora cassiicola Philippines]